MNHLALARQFLDRACVDKSVADAQTAAEHAVRAYHQSTGDDRSSAARLVASSLQPFSPAADAVAWYQLAGDDLETARAAAAEPMPTGPAPDLIALEIDAAFGSGADGARATLDEMFTRPDLTVAQKLAILRGRANVENQCKEWAAAIGFRRQAVEVAPDDAAVYLELGLECFNGSQDDDALAAYARAGELGEALGRDHNGIGCVHLANERWAEAEAAFAQAAAIRIADAEVRFHLGRSVMKLGRADEARAIIGQAAQLGHGTAGQWAQKFDIAVPTAWFDAANQRLGQGAAGASLEFYDKCIEVLRQQSVVTGDVFSRLLAQALSNKGFALCQLDRWQDAEPLTREAIEHRPGLRDAHNHLGNALAETGRHELALDAFRRCAELDPSYAGAPYGEAGALEKLDRFDEALAAIDRALAIGYDHPGKQADLEKRKQFIQERAS